LGVFLRDIGHQKLTGRIGGHYCLDRSSPSGVDAATSTTHTRSVVARCQEVDVPTVRP